MNKIKLNNDVKTLNNKQNSSNDKKSSILKSLGSIDDESSSDDLQILKEVSNTEKPVKKRGRPKIKGNIIQDHKYNDNKSDNEDSHHEQMMTKEIEIIDKIIKLFPEMKKKRDLILTEIVTPKKVVDNDYVLERIEINGGIYYKDKYKCILNSNIEIVGIWEDNGEKCTYHIFKDEVGKIKNLNKKFSIND